MAVRQAARAANKRALLRTSELLQDYLKGLKTEQADLIAEHERLQTILDLIERQMTTLKEAIDIDAKLAEFDVGGSRTPEAGVEGLSREIA